MTRESTKCFIYRHIFERSYAQNKRCRYSPVKCVSLHGVVRSLASTEYIDQNLEMFSKGRHTPFGRTLTGLSQSGPLDDDLECSQLPLILQTLQRYFDQALIGTGSLYLSTILEAGLPTCRRSGLDPWQRTTLQPP